MDRRLRRVNRTRRVGRQATIQQAGHSMRAQVAASTLTSEWAVSKAVGVREATKAAYM